MVLGIDSFREKFKDYTEYYTIIGGTACDILLTEADLCILLRKPGRLASQYACRHTYCTNMALAGMNPKTLQYLMGHSEIGVTLDVYTHVSF